MAKNEAIEAFLSDVDSRGIATCMSELLANYIRAVRPDIHVSDMRKPNGLYQELIATIEGPEDMGAIYEQALAHVDKGAKKKQGQYYTPHDVSGIHGSRADRQHSSRTQKC